MKTSLTHLFSAILLGATCSVASAQVTLNAGDVFTHEFNFLNSAGMTDLPVGPLGNYSAILNPLTVQPGDVIFLELFENSLAETPVATRTFDGLSLVSCQAAFAWQDLQGAIRLTMLSGSATLDVITLRALTPSAGPLPLNAWDLTIVPVPEPGGLALAGLGLAAALGWRGQRWHRNRDRGEEAP